MRRLHTVLVLLVVVAAPVFAWKCAKDLESQFEWKKTGAGEACEASFDTGAPSFQVIMPEGTAPITTHGLLIKPDEGVTKAKGEDECDIEKVENQDTHLLRPLGLTDEDPPVYYVSANRLARRKGVHVLGDKHLCCIDDLNVYQGEEVPITKCAVARNGAALERKFVHFSIQHGYSCGSVFSDFLAHGPDCTFHDKTEDNKCVEFLASSRTHTETGCVPAQLGKCFGSEKAITELNEGKLATGVLAEHIRSFQYGHNKKGKQSTRTVPGPVSQRLQSPDMQHMCCRLTSRAGRQTMICGKAAASQTEQVVTDDAKMGLPAKLNANGCYNFLNNLTAADHTRLVVLELEAFYSKVARSEKFWNWAGLVLWSIMRASDQYEWLHSDDPVKNSQSNRAKYGYVLPPRSLEQANKEWLVDVIEKASKHNLTFTSLDSKGKAQGCRKVGFFMNLVLEGRIKATRNVNRKWEAGRFAMKVISSAVGLAASASPVPGTGPAAVSVVNMVDNLVGTLATEQTARHSFKQVIIQAFENMVAGILVAKDDDKKDDKKDSKKDDAPKDDAPKQGGEQDQPKKKSNDNDNNLPPPPPYEKRKSKTNMFLEVDSAKAKRHKVRVQRAHTLDHATAHASTGPPSDDAEPAEGNPFAADTYFAEMEKYAEGDCSLQYYEIVRLFKFLFVEPTQEEAQLGKKTRQYYLDGIEMCHAKVGGDTKTANSWRSMIRLHKKFVDGKWPGQMTSTDDAGGKVTRALLYWEKVVGPLLLSGQNVITPLKPFMGLNKLWKDYAATHNILQNGTAI